MPGDVGDGSFGAADVSDVNIGGASIEPTDTTELYDGAVSSQTDVTDQYSTELTETENLADSELYEQSSNEERVDSIESDGKVEADSKESDKNEAVKDSESDRTDINENSEYSNEVNERISSKEELDVYQNANLKEEVIDGHKCLDREIKLDYVDPKTGMTNRELMEKGRSPYDAKTGERIDIHHVGQEYDSPYAELTVYSEHQKFTSVLHTKETESWRNDEQKKNHYNGTQRPNHWKERVKEIEINES